MCRNTFLEWCNAAHFYECWLGRKPQLYFLPGKHEVISEVDFKRTIVQLVNPPKHVYMSLQASRNSIWVHKLWQALEASYCLWSPQPWLSIFHVLKNLGEVIFNLSLHFVASRVHLRSTVQSLIYKVQCKPKFHVQESGSVLSLTLFCTLEQWRSCKESGVVSTSGTTMHISTTSLTVRDILSSNSKVCVEWLQWWVKGTVYTLWHLQYLAHHLWCSYATALQVQSFFTPWFLSWFLAPTKR